MAKLQEVFAYLGYAPKLASDAIKTAKEKTSASVKDIFDSFTKKTEEKNKGVHRPMLRIILSRIIKQILDRNLRE